MSFFLSATVTPSHCGVDRSVSLPYHPDEKPYLVVCEMPQANECPFFADFLYEIEPKKVSHVLKHQGWVDAMKEELNQYHRNKVWTLVPAPRGKSVSGSKWWLETASQIQRDAVTMKIKTASHDSTTASEHTTQPII
ncbi:hypothetical protein Tco_0184855 [Tanacetum coccineum]